VRGGGTVGEAQEEVRGGARLAEVWPPFGIGCAGRRGQTACGHLEGGSHEQTKAPYREGPDDGP
jgi:hypothetical protein